MTINVWIYVCILSATTHPNHDFVLQQRCLNHTLMALVTMTPQHASLYASMKEGNAFNIRFQQGSKFDKVLG